MPIALGYCRQSLGQAGESASDSLSLDTQENRIRAWCEAEGWAVDQVYRDHDLRGTTLDRPGWREVVKRVEAGGVDGIVVFALSRVARDNLLQETAWRHLRSLNVRLISVTEPAAEDNMVRGILGVLSQAERERMGKFISAAARERIRRGVAWGEPPFGFRKGGTPGERARPTEPDPETAEIARQMADMALAGESAFTIARTLTLLGAPPPREDGKPWRHTTVRRWLRNPKIAGGLDTPEGIIWDCHPGIVTRDEWERIGVQLERRAFTRSVVTTETMLRGILFHGCGRRMVANKGTGTGRNSVYYRCPNAAGAAGVRCQHPPVNISARKVDRAAIAALSADLDTITTPAAVLADWNANHNGPSVADQRARLERDRQAAMDTAERAEALYMTGRRDLAWLNEQDAEVTQRLAGIDRELAALDVPPDIDALSASAAHLGAFADVLPLATLDALRPALRALGVVQVDGDDLWWRYSDEAALLMPEPTRVRWR